MPGNSSATETRERQVVRALIVSPESSILLLRVVLPDRSCWITPGGGIEAGEDARSALQRELEEETGHSSWNIGRAVWSRSHTFEFDGETLTNHEHYHWVASDWFEPPETMPDAHERRFFGGYKWWTIGELQASDARFAPRRIGYFLARLVSEGIPPEPIAVGV